MPCDLILALDAQSPHEVTPTLKQLQGTLRWVKIGLEMYVANGPDCVREIAGLGFKVFLDLKLHDIPNTVAKSVESVSKLPIQMLTLHTVGGREMLQWAVKAQQQAAPNLLLLGVTVLTSTSAAGLAETGVADSPEKQVIRLGRLAVDSGLRGLVCRGRPRRSQFSRRRPPDLQGLRPRRRRARDSRGNRAEIRGQKLEVSPILHAFC